KRAWTASPGPPVRMKRSSFRSKPTAESVAVNTQTKPTTESVSVNARTNPTAESVAVNARTNPTTESVSANDQTTRAAEPVSVNVPKTPTSRFIELTRTLLQRAVHTALHNLGENIRASWYAFSPVGFASKKCRCRAG